MARNLQMVCHGANSDDLVSIPAMADTVAVNFEFILLDYKKKLQICFNENNNSYNLKGVRTKR